MDVPKREVTVRGPWSGYKRAQLQCNDKSRTKQSDAKDADINTIIKKALRNGRLPDASNAGMYVDLSTGQDFMESMQIVKHAQEQFQALPSNVRHEFQNDPAKFLDFANNPENLERMYDLGLKVRPNKDDQSNSRPDSGNSEAGSVEASSQIASDGGSQDQGSA